MITINGLNYKVSERRGECGADEHTHKLCFPLFNMGCSGSDNFVVKQMIVPAPKQMDYEWFKKIATIIKNNEMLDWDWRSFRDNILSPNKNHIKQVLNLDEDKWDTFEFSGFVFLNNFYDESIKLSFENFLKPSQEPFQNAIQFIQLLSYNPLFKGRGKDFYNYVCSYKPSS